MTGRDRRREWKKKWIISINGSARKGSGVSGGRMRSALRGMQGWYGAWYVGKKGVVLYARRRLD